MKIMLEEENDKHKAGFNALIKAITDNLIDLSIEYPTDHIVNMWDFYIDGNKISYRISNECTDKALATKISAVIERTIFDFDKNSN